MASPPRSAPDAITAGKAGGTSAFPAVMAITRRGGGSVPGGEERVQQLPGGQRRGELAGQHVALQLRGGRPEGGVLAERVLQLVAHQLPGPADLLLPAARAQGSRRPHPVLVLDDRG